MRLNGWRRLGIILTLVWVLGCSAVAFLQVSFEDDGVFALRGPPAGTVVNSEKGTITLPDGKVVHMWEDAPTGAAGQETKIPGFPKPWEIDWGDYPEVAHTRTDWFVFIAISVIMPAVMWILLEVTVFVAWWIRRGFLPPT